MEDIKLELERAKLKNYILQKENEILLGTIGMVCREKAQMKKEVEKYRRTIMYRLKGRIRKIIKRKDNKEK